MLPPIDTSGYSKENVRELAEHCHQVMLQHLAKLDSELQQPQA